MSEFTIGTDGHGGYVVLLDGQPQSHVNLEDPEDLAFEYIAIAAAVLRGVFADRDVVRATHVGGAGLTVPRWIQHVWPGSPQIVLEPNAALTEAVRRELPLPRGHRIRVRERDGLTGVRELADASADLILIDAYADGRVPADLTTTACLAECARVVGSSGIVVLNLADEANGRYVDRVAAGAREAGLRHVAAYATSDVARGRRLGNRVVVASAQPVENGAIARELRRLPWSAGPTKLRDARAFGEADAEMSPIPPALERSWRVR